MSSPPGIGAVALIRLSGNDCYKICDKVFYTSKEEKVKTASFQSHTLHFGLIKTGKVIVDEVLLSVFKAPRSFTGEDVIEISCHGSLFIQQQILQLLVMNGARIAEPGEFTFRAFINGRMDLSQAEAVADLIASNSSTSHQLAMQQMRGGFSKKIKLLREHLVNFASLIELELDFSEEDVEFADRNDLKKLLNSIKNILNNLVQSFELGNVIKNGIPVVIAGKPNAGKSTLLNALLEEDKAIVSEIPGTTRDAIEDEFIIEGILFRFIDTAGIRATTDTIEQIGVSKTFEKIKQSAIVIYLFDVNELSVRELEIALAELKSHTGNVQIIVAGNKIDKTDAAYTHKEFASVKDVIFISAKESNGLEALKKKLVELFDHRTVNISETVVTNARHVKALQDALNAVSNIETGLNTNLSGELLATDIRNALHCLGNITGEITSEDLLDNVFSKFCIGK